MAVEAKVKEELKFSPSSRTAGTVTPEADKKAGDVDLGDIEDAGRKFGSSSGSTNSSSEEDRPERQESGLSTMTQCSVVLPKALPMEPADPATANVVAEVKAACQNKGCGGCSQATANSSPVAKAAAALGTAPITTSTFELFKVGIGPSSSHTVGPLVACRNFAKALVDGGLLASLHRVRVELCGSLALTGIGHYTNKAVVVGLTGIAPSKLDTTKIEGFLAGVAERKKLMVGFGSEALGEYTGEYVEIDFEELRDVHLFAEELPLHPNGMVCQAFDKDDNLLKDTTYYSIGGGFVNTAEELVGDGDDGSRPSLPLKFGSMAELLKLCSTERKSIAEVMRTNEESLRTPEEVEEQLAEIWRVMENCVDRGLSPERAGEDLPGPLGISRRAPDLYAFSKAEEDSALFPVISGLMDEMRWLDCYALAVMEENACMGQVVTAPTNGASGVVPAVLTYYMRHLREKQPEHRKNSPSTFLLAAASVGILAKEKACISGAAGGCQAEVGTASAMAAAGLCAALGGTPQQVAEAAEIALEHSLGMTCDPVLGLVQVPCIERNTMGAAKALNAVSLVLRSPVTKRKAMLTYDDVLRVMKETGKDMSSRYRETAQGGLAADYEATLQKEPEKWAEVQQLMGVKRILIGPRLTPRKIISYEDASKVRALVPHLELSVC